MKFLGLDYEHSLVTDKEIREIGKKLQPEIGRIKNAVSQGYKTAYASLALPTDKAMLESVLAMIKFKKAIKPRVLIVVGIGGSNLGTWAVHEAVHGKLYNETDPELKVYFADTVDTDYLQRIKTIAEHELKRGNPVLVNVISKSGSTTETIANFEIFLELLVKYYPADYHQYIVATTDKGSMLWDLAQESKFALLEVPSYVGGRYSVFSPVGLFPLGMGIDVKHLLDGAYSAIVASTSDDIYENLAALNAAIIYLNYKNGISINDIFLFGVQLEGLGKWYRQLMGESIGKADNKEGEEVHIGITPTVSIGSTDLHSVGQLYLGGPKNTFFSFVRIDSQVHTLKIPHMLGYDKVVKDIQGRPLSDVMDAIIDGVQKAFAKNERPFITITIPKTEPFFIAQFLQLKMIEMMYLGFLLEVNPFDQPQVELYKKETRAILAK